MWTVLLLYVDCFSVLKQAAALGLPGTLFCELLEQAAACLWIVSVGRSPSASYQPQSWTVLWLLVEVTTLFELDLLFGGLLVEVSSC